MNKRLIPLLLLLLLAGGSGCDKNDASTAINTAAPTVSAAAVQAPMTTPAPYDEPFSYEAMDEDGLFGALRIALPLPEGAEDVCFARILTRSGVDAAEVRFTYDGRDCRYRAAYTTDEQNLADDNADYPEIYWREYAGQSYCLCCGTGLGRVQWYEKNSGTSRSLLIVSDATEESLDTLATLLMGLLQQ